MAIDYFNLGRIYFARKNLDEARTLLTKSLELYRTVGKTDMVDTLKKGLAQIENASQQQTTAN